MGFETDWCAIVGVFKSVLEDHVGGRLADRARVVGLRVQSFVA